MVPTNVIVNWPEAATADTPNVTAWLAPAGIVNGDGGVLVTPLGRPVMATLTVLAKPFWPLTVIETGELTEPCAAATDPETERLKSAVGLAGDSLREQSAANMATLPRRSAADQVWIVREATTRRIDSPRNCWCAHDRIAAGVSKLRSYKLLQRDGPITATSRAGQASLHS